MDCKGGEVTDEDLEFVESTSQYPPRLKMFVPEQHCHNEFVTVKFNDVKGSFTFLLKKKV